MKLGNEVRDKITGITGYATGKASYITGCDQILVQPAVKDGAFVDGRWLDAGRLEVIAEGIELESVQAEDPGCDAVAPVK